MDINRDRFLPYYLVVKKGKMELLYIEGDDDLRRQLDDSGKSFHYSTTIKK
jgi:hypothetical protein